MIRAYSWSILISDSAYQHVYMSDIRETPTEKWVILTAF